MQFQISREFSVRVATVFLFAIILLQLSPLLVQAQNLGGAPQVDKAVQGQTAAQPEGAFLNLVNWVGNVIAPVAPPCAWSWRSSITPMAAVLLVGRLRALAC